MIYRNTKTGAEIVSKCEIIAENWVLVNEEPEKPVEKPAEKPKAAKKRTTK